MAQVKTILVMSISGLRAILLLWLTDLTTPQASAQIILSVKSRTTALSFSIVKLTASSQHLNSTLIRFIETLKPSVLCVFQKVQKSDFSHNTTLVETFRCHVRLK